MSGSGARPGCGSDSTQHEAGPATDLVAAAAAAGEVGVGVGGRGVRGARERQRAVRVGVAAVDGGDGNGGVWRMMESVRWRWR